MIPYYKSNLYKALYMTEKKSVCDICKKRTKHMYGVNNKLVCEKHLLQEYNQQEINLGFERLKQKVDLICNPIRYKFWDNV